MKAIIFLILVTIGISNCAISFKDLATSLCLEGDSNKGVFSNDCNLKNAFQKWILNPSESTTIAGQVFKDLKNVVSGLCLDSDAKTKLVFGVECNSVDSQKWTINNKEVRNAVGLCLESDSNNRVFLNDCIKTNFPTTITTLIIKTSTISSNSSTNVFSTALNITNNLTSISNISQSILALSITIYY